MLDFERSHALKLVLNRIGVDMPPFLQILLSGAQAELQCLK